MIKYLKNGYVGKIPCKDFDEDCVSCQAQKVIEFLEKHLLLIKY